MIVLTIEKTQSGARVRAKARAKANAKARARANRARAIEQLTTTVEKLVTKQDEESPDSGVRPKCEFVFPNGDRCNGPHHTKDCWFKHPDKCKDPKIKKMVERKLQAKSTTSEADAHYADPGYDDTDDMWYY